ncbi:MAG: hypothetical protein MI919_41385 [Holophagales bacterium]|nr:hypothetical protein [Holophagales bacterium]
MKDTSRRLGNAVLILLVTSLALAGGLVPAQEQACEDETCTLAVTLCHCCPHAPRTVLAPGRSLCGASSWTPLRVDSPGVFSEPPPEDILHVPRHLSLIS